MTWVWVALLVLTALHVGLWVGLRQLSTYTTQLARKIDALDKEGHG